MSFIRKINRNGKTYLAEVENQRIRGKVVQKHIRYIGKAADGKTILSASISDATVDKVRLHMVHLWFSIILRGKFNYPKYVCSV